MFLWKRSDFSPARPTGPFRECAAHPNDPNILFTQDVALSRALLDRDNPAKAIIADLNDQIQRPAFQADIERLPAGPAKYGYIKNREYLDLEGRYPNIHNLLIDLGDRMDLQLIFWKLHLGNALNINGLHQDTPPNGNADHPDVDMTAAINLRGEKSGTTYAAGDYNAFSPKDLEKGFVPMDTVRKLEIKGKISLHTVGVGEAAIFPVNSYGAHKALLHDATSGADRVSLIGSYGLK